MSQSLTPYLNQLQTLFSPKTNNLIIKFLPPTLLTAISIPLLTNCYTNYTAWRNIGPGGVPYNIFGWAAQALLGLFISNDLLSTEVYTDPKTIEKYGPNSNKRFIVGSLEVRDGEPPDVPLFVAPQRQVGGASDEKIRELQQNLLSEIALSNPQTVVIKTSVLEKIGPALFLSPNVPHPPGKFHSSGEFAHIHLDAEGSSHITLSLADAKEVIEKGWGRRHKLSGVLVPISYLLIYAPRNEEEVEVLQRILRASVAFVTAGVKGEGDDA